MRTFNRLHLMLPTTLVSASFFCLVVLAVGKAFGNSIPCSTRSFCNEVGNLNIAYFLGIPLSYLGLFLTTVCLYSMYTGRLKSVVPLLVVAGLGSLGLQVYVRYRFSLNCVWCLGAALSMICGALTQLNLPRQLNVARSDRVLCTLASGIAVLGVAYWMSTTSPLRQSSFDGAATAKLRELAQGRQFVIFGSLSCPACRSLYQEVIRRGAESDSRFIYFDVHGKQPNLAKNVAFRLASGKSTSERLNLLEAYAAADVIDLPINSEGAAKALSAEYDVSKSLGIVETPTVVQVIDGTVARKVGISFYKSSLVDGSHVLPTPSVMLPRSHRGG